VVLPAYDGERWIEESLGSVLAQTVRDVEAVVVDDGSRDGTVAIVERMAAADPRVRLVRATHGGVAKARNRGLAEARGEFVVFLDQDDALERAALAAGIAVLEANPGRRYAHGLLRFVGEPDRWGRTTFPLADHVPATTFLEAFRHTGALSPGQILARRADVVAAGGFPEGPEYALADDRALWVGLAARGVMPAFHRTVVLRYRRHAGQASRDLLRVKRSKLALLEAFAGASAGDPPRPLLTPAESGPVVAAAAIDLAYDLLDVDPREANAVAARAVSADPALVGDRRWRQFRRKRWRKRLGRLPLVGPLIAVRRRDRGP
jgi:glycosyltransferase involved in cell wall biosynthesis